LVIKDYRWVVFKIVSGMHKIPSIKPVVISSSSGTELPLITESFGFLNDLFPFPSILDADDPVFNLQLKDILFDVILPYVLGFSL
jgi:hypothetical protein